MLYARSLAPFTPDPLFSTRTRFSRVVRSVNSLAFSDRKFAPKLALSAVRGWAPKTTDMTPQDIRLRIAPLGNCCAFAQGSCIS